MSMRYQAGFLTASYFPLKAPNAPTIGTATASNASAVVTFTAPANVGGGAITGYIAISSPGGFTGTGVSSPITVSGLTNGTAYTFTVIATNAYGTGPASAASNSVTPINVVSAIELLIVAGGGGGGYNGNGGRAGGGGAGGLLYYGSETPKTPNGTSVAVLPSVAYAITIGAGGVPKSPTQTGNGVDSSFIGGAVSITSTGGGGGAYADGGIGNTGGSGGGSWYNAPSGGGAGTSGQGNDGGQGSTTPSYGGGGGGGAGVAGGAGTSTTGGSGGNGLAYVISSASTYYAGGGSGDIYGVIGTSPGVAGLGGGGTGNNVSNGTSGTANTGGGGGSYNGSGGSGVVILRYADTLPAATSTTGSPTVTVTGGYRIYKFTSTGSITF